jgi:hypothetical protein
MASNSADGYWEAEADVSWVPGSNGTYSIYGTHWYWLENNYLWVDGETNYSLELRSLPPAHGTPDRL